jgi:manganese-dependent inorganic pyrophosphatase
MSSASVPDAGPLAARRSELLEAMEQVRAEHPFHLLIFIGTDISRKSSHLWAAGNGLDLVERAFRCPQLAKGAFLEGCVSRKKQVAPVLDAAFAAV